MTNVDRTNRMPRFTTPREDAIIFHIDMDVMKERMSMFYLPAQVRVQADSATVLKQILRRIEQHGAEQFTDIDVSQQRMVQHRELLDKVAQRDSQTISRSSPANTMDLHQVLTALRQRLPENNLVLNESISNYPAVWMNLAPTRPGCEYHSEYTRYDRVADLTHSIDHFWRVISGLGFGSCHRCGPSWKS